MRSSVPARPGRRSTSDDDEVHDRIDFVYAAGEVAVIDAYTMGFRDTPPTDRMVPGYPSDHRSVVVAFALGSSDVGSSDESEQ